MDDSPSRRPFRVVDTKCGNDISTHCTGAVVNGKMLILQPLICPACGEPMFWEDTGPRIQVARIVPSSGQAGPVQ